MTTRPGQPATEALRWSRTKHLCHVVQVAPFKAFGALPASADLLLTDHDRALTFEGRTYRPMHIGGFSADRREAAFRSGNQEVRGVIDGDVIRLVDINGNRYRGAEVQIAVVDWREPWRVYARHRKWIRTLTWDGSTWTGTLEARSSVVQRPSGGRFGGTFSPYCTYELGSSDCKKNIAPGTGFTAIGGRVDAIIKDRQVLELDPASATEVHPDGWYRDGSLRWLFGPPLVAGTITSNSTSLTLTDATKSWTTNEHAGRWVKYLTGANGGVASFADYARIASNTATVLTFESGISIYSTGKHYEICGDAANIGTVSPIVGYTHATRRIELLVPTPRPIVIGDSGVLRAGCDGLFGTCKAKFANQINFGGDPYAPTVQQIIAPPEKQ